MTVLITVLALLAPQPIATDQPLVTIPWEKRPLGIPMPLPGVVPQRHESGPDLNHAIDQWFEEQARNEAWFAWEREQWFAAERANAERIVASYNPTPPSWLHAWITDAILDALGMCESTNNYSANTGNGFRGRVQWLQNTWNAAATRAQRPDLVGVRPDQAAPADQDLLTKVWWQASDYRTQWPVCSLVAIRKAGNL